MNTGYVSMRSKDENSPVADYIMVAYTYKKNLKKVFLDRKRIISSQMTTSRSRKEETEQIKTANSCFELFFSA